MNKSKIFYPKYIEIDEYIKLLNDNPWISNINIDKKYEYNYRKYIDNYIGEKSYILKNDLQIFFSILDINFIKIEDFLNKMYDLFDNFIKTDDGIKNYILLQSKLEKSNTWMYLLFIEYLIKTKYIDKIKNRLFITSLVGNKVENPVGFDLDLSHKYTLLIIDDCSYTGNQINNRINSIFNSNSKTFISTSIDNIIIISFMSCQAINFIKSEKI